MIEVLTWFSVNGMLTYRVDWKFAFVSSVVWLVELPNKDGHHSFFGLDNQDKLLVTHDYSIDDVFMIHFQTFWSNFFKKRKKNDKYHDWKNRGKVCNVNKHFGWVPNSRNWKVSYVENWYLLETCLWQWIAATLCNLTRPYKLLCWRQKKWWSDDEFDSNVTRLSNTKKWEQVIFCCLGGLIS